MKLFEVSLNAAKALLQRFSKVVLVGLVLLSLGWMALPAQAMPTLKAGTPNLIATGSRAAGSVEMDRAKGEVDRMWGEGSHESVEGKIDETLGSVKRRVGDMTDDSEMEARGVGDQLKGQAKYGKGQAESAFEDAREQVEDTTQGIIDNVKDVFR